jgi:hypothetical protein
MMPLSALSLLLLLVSWVLLHVALAWLESFDLCNFFFRAWIFYLQCWRQVTLLEICDKPGPRFQLLHFHALMI